MTNVNKGTIKQFFSDISHVLCDDRKIEKEELRTNIIYLNTNCNLRCEYCYEDNSRKGLPDQANVTPEMIDDYIDDIMCREGESNSCLCIMGGEPTLKLDLFAHVIKKLIATPKKGGWSVPMTTNAILFDNNKYLSAYLKISKIANDHNIDTNLEISYDGSGHYRRKFPNGKSSRHIVERVLWKLNRFKIPFRVSYTVHLGNFASVVHDLLNIILTYNYCERIYVRYAQQELDNHFGLEVDNFYNILSAYYSPYLRQMYKKFGIPLCDQVCDLCNLCQISVPVGNSYLSPTEGLIFTNKSSRVDFTHF